MDFDLALRLVTYLILILEVALPLLLISRRWHRVGMITGLLFHFGIFVTSNNLLMFFLSMMVLYLSFLRSDDIGWLMQKTKRLLQKRDSKPGASKRKGSMKA